MIVYKCGTCGAELEVECDRLVRRPEPSHTITFYSCAVCAEEAAINALERRCDFLEDRLYHEREYEMTEFNIGKFVGWWFGGLLTLVVWLLYFELIATH